MKTARHLAALAFLSAVWPSRALADDATSSNPGGTWAKPCEKGKSCDLPGCSIPLWPGLPSLPDYHCRQDCCADHDACYNANTCTMASWGPTLNQLNTTGMALWLGFPAGTLAGDMLNAEALPIVFGTPSANDALPACVACNEAVTSCWAMSVISPFTCAAQHTCGPNQEACYDRACTAGTNFYCSTNCYNPLTDPCEQEYGDVRCQAAVALGYAALTRAAMHGGAALSCVPECYNTLAAQNLLNNPGTTLCAADYDEANPAASAGGFISSAGGGSVCCFCKGNGLLPWEDPLWPYETNVPVHNGVEGGYGTIAGCHTGCPCLPPANGCYAIGACWSDGHMCAQAPCGQEIGMCCG